MQQGAKWSVQNTTRLVKDETFLNVAGHIKTKRREEKGKRNLATLPPSSDIKKVARILPRKKKDYRNKQTPNYKGNQ
jgi:hypothetical protein